MEEIFALAFESRCSIRHYTFTLGCSDFAAQIGLSGLAELAFLTFRGTGDLL